uniref:3-oxoadipate enol-lactonase n=1 Tax=Thermosporothrix sp. COM3 TaxID=2490863 RepID=A0A455SI26_9CHLR|nr:3-oxoadipate enol-lactonase [Thermosporothrix sp. COM3]
MQDRSFIKTGDGYRTAYRLDGPEDKPVLMLSNSIGTTLNMWDGQIEELTQHFRVLRYDMRGHGASDVPPGAYSIDRLGRDAIELLDALQLNQVHFLGLSLGGMVGQWLGIHAPERIGRLILSNTSPYLGPADQWDELIVKVKQETREETANRFLKNWFPTHLLESPVVEPFRSMLLSMDPQGFAGNYAAVRDMDMRRTNALIPVPTLVIAGRNDTVTLPEHGEQIAEAIPNAQLVMLPAVHMANVEQTAEFMKAVLSFLLSK